MRQRSIPAVLAVGAALALAACSSGGGTSAGGGGGGGAGGATTTTGAGGPGTTKATLGPIPERFAGFTSALYADDANWLCKPGIAKDYCLTENIDSTIVRADGTTEVVKRKVVTDAPFDCFYVYPTVNLKPGGGNDLEMANEIGTEVAVLRTQAARFTELCNVYAPLYRQMQLSAYGSPGMAEAEAMAYGDVKDAFRHYLANDNGGRPFVLMGHSQGSGHLAKLLKEEFDADPSMRARLISALLLGGQVKVPEGTDVGGTFENLALCRATTQTGCVVAFNTFNAAGPGEDTRWGSPDAKGNVPACVNPAAPAGGKATLKPFATVNQLTGLTITTDFAQLPDAIAGECLAKDGQFYFGISVVTQPGDTRDVTKLAQNVPGWGLHITEVNLVMGNLLDLVRGQAAALR